MYKELEIFIERLITLHKKIALLKQKAPTIPKYDLN